jgi:hypothetical protein
MLDIQQHIPTWAKRQVRKRSTTPRAPRRNRLSHQVRQLRIVDAIYATIQTTSPTPARKRASINKTPRLSLLATPASWLSTAHPYLIRMNKQACATRMIDYWDEEHLCPSCLLPSHFAHECNINETHVTQHVNHVRKKNRDTSLLQHMQEAREPHSNSLQLPSVRERSHQQMHQTKCKHGPTSDGRDKETPRFQLLPSGRQFQRLLVNPRM